MILPFGGVYNSKVVIIEEDTDVEGGFGVGVRETEARELTGGWFGGFSEPLRSETFSCQS